MRTLAKFSVFLGLPLLSHTGERLISVAVGESANVQASDGEILCVLCGERSKLMKRVYRTAESCLVRQSACCAIGGVHYLE